MQKPQAYSAIRFCESFYRLFVYWTHGEAAATACRSELLQFASDEAKPIKQADLDKSLREIKLDVEQGDWRRAFVRATDFRRQLLWRNSEASADHRVTVPGFEVYEEISELWDPVP